MRKTLQDYLINLMYKTLVERDKTFEKKKKEIKQGKKAGRAVKCLYFNDMNEVKEEHGEREIR